MRLKSIAGALLFAVLGTLPLPAQEEKPAVPDEAARKRVLTEIRELFKQDYASRNPESRAALAAKLLSEAIQTTGAPASRFVLLAEARDLASEGGAVATAFNAIDRMEEFFDLPAASGMDTPVEMKQDVLAKALRLARQPEEAREVASGYLQVARQAAGEGDFRAAQDAIRRAGTLARKARDKGLAAETASFSKVIPELKREYGILSKVDLTQAIDIGDKRTNLDVGRLLCFVRKEWEKGLEYLQWSGDKDLADVAKKELARPADPEAQAAAAETWYALSKKERNALHRKRYQRRAKYWYDLAVVDAQGLTRTRINKRLDELEEFLPGAINLLRLVNPAEDAVVGTWKIEDRALVCVPAPRARLEFPYTPPEEYDLTVEFHRVGGGDAIGIGLAHPRSSFAVWLDGFPALGYRTGLSILDRIIVEDSPLSIKGGLLTNDRPYTAICAVRKDGVRVSIDGKEIFKYEGKLDRLTQCPIWNPRTPRKILVGAWETRVRFSKVVLTPVSGVGKKLR